MATVDGDLERRLAGLAARVEAKVAYSIAPLDGGAAIRANATDVMPTASTFKLYVLGAPDFNTGDNHPFNLLIAEMSRAVFEAWGRE